MGEKRLSIDETRLDQPLKEENGDIPEKELEALYKDHPLTEDTTCGIGYFKQAWLQKFSNEKAYVCIYGVMGCMMNACGSYFTGTLTTIEKRFKIPSKTLGLIMVGNDMSSLFVSLFISYYAGKKHRPRWFAAGGFSTFLYCVLTVLPHYIYGVGEDALALTEEYGDIDRMNISTYNPESDHSSVFCTNTTHVEKCQDEDVGGINIPFLIFFTANFISGISIALYWTIGISYMDDNIEKRKIPFLISIAHFLRLMGPALGYSLASLSLEMYIDPSLTPTITTSDTRWVGAWWIGWLFLAVITFVLATLIGLFPKVLPKAAVRRMVTNEKLRQAGKEPEKEAEPPSVTDMLQSFKRVITNKVYVTINLASIFYIFGYIPWWIFMAKYIETQFRQSASLSSLVTGTVGLVFSAVGILASGSIISKLKPRARTLAAWNLLVIVMNTIGLSSYAFIGCSSEDSYSGTLLPSGLLDMNTTCNSNCQCENVRFTPVCSSDGNFAFVSPCHAGCTGERLLVNDTVRYTNCSCVMPSFLNSTSPLDSGGGGYVTEGACPNDCLNPLILFLVIVCVLKFIGAASMSSKFLVSVRCVEERDKTVAMGIHMGLIAVFAFIPAPVFFGYILDLTCIVWGKTCSGEGNCWVYDKESMRNLLSVISAVFMGITAVFDVFVWVYVKNVKIFDDEETEKKEKKKKGTKQNSVG